MAGAFSKLSTEGEQGIHWVTARDKMNAGNWSSDSSVCPETREMGSCNERLDAKKLSKRKRKSTENSYLSENVAMGDVTWSLRGRQSWGPQIWTFQLWTVMLLSPFFFFVCERNKQGLSTSFFTLPSQSTPSQNTQRHSQVRIHR